MKYLLRDIENWGSRVCLALFAVSWCLLSGLPGSAQAPAWDLATTCSSTQTSGTSQTQATAVDASGNVFVTGYFTGHVAFGSTLLASVGTQNDLFVAKYMPSTGTWAWAQRAGGTGQDYGYAIAVSGNNVYVTGSIFNDDADTYTVRFGSVGATPNPTVQHGASTWSSADMVVAKYTDNGSSATLAWTQVGGGTSTDVGYGIAVSGSSVYVTGSISNDLADIRNVRFGGSGTTPGTVAQQGASVFVTSDLLVAKYTDNGGSATLAWTQVAGGRGADVGYGIAANGSNVYVTGQISNGLTDGLAVRFGGSGTTPGTLVQHGTATSGPDLLLAKYVDNGSTATVAWTQVGGGILEDAGRGVAVSGTSVYVTGNISNDLADSRNVRFGGTGTTPGTVAVSGVSSAIISSDVLVAKYTDNGSTAALVWTQVGGGARSDMGAAIAVRGASVYITGRITNDLADMWGVRFGGGTVQTGASYQESQDVFAAKYTDNGSTATLAWTQAGGGTGPDLGTGIVVSGSQVYVGGSVGNGFNVAFGTAAVSSALGTSIPNAVLAHLTDAGASPWQTLVPTANGGQLSIQATATDASGNVFVTGYFFGVVTFGSTVLTTAGSNDLFVAKYVPGTATWAWAQRGGGTHADAGAGIAVRGNSVYVTGSLSNDLADFCRVNFSAGGPVAGAGSQHGATPVLSRDLLVAKYVDNGSSATLAWTQVGGGTSNDYGAALAVSGTSVYVTGSIFNTSTDTNAVRFGGSGATPGTAVQLGASPTLSEDLLVAKYTDNGSSATLAWTQVGGGSNTDAGYGIAASGPNVYVTGSIVNDRSDTQAVRFGGAGATAGTAVQLGTSPTMAFQVNTDMVVAKYVDNGSSVALAWTQVGGGTGQDEGYAIALNGTSLYVAGRITSDLADVSRVRFGGAGTTAGTAVQLGASSGNSSDIVVAKYADNGSSATLVWTQVGGGIQTDIGRGIAVNGSNIYVTGTISNDAADSQVVRFGGTGTTPGTASQLGSGTIPRSDVLLAKYTDNGPTATFAWAQVGGGGDNVFSFNTGNSITLSGPRIYVSGLVQPVASFSGLVPNAVEMWSIGFLGRITDPAITAVRAASATGDPLRLRVWPNPTATSTVSASGLPAGTPVQVLNALGRTVAEAAAAPDGTAQLTLPANLAAGIYVVRGGGQALRLAVE